MQNRLGETHITSVSVSNEFMQIVKKYNLSPTEVFRKGVAVSLCEFGLEKYDTKINQERLKKANELLKDIREFERIKSKLIKIKEALEFLNNV